MRIPIPSLTEERRKELSRHVHKMAEEGRNHVRVVRRDANDKLKKMLKEHQISEDDEKRALDEVQKITDQHIKTIDELQQRRTRSCWGNSYFTHLECSSGCGAGPFDPRELHFLCPSCRLPLLARYDLAAARAWKRESLVGREPNMWRYRELLPLLPGDEPVTLGEGFTPLIHAKRLGATLGLERLFIKDESLNPTNSFKARGLSAAITRAKALGADDGLPADRRQRRQRRRRLRRGRRASRARCSSRKDAKQPFIDECRLYGANVTLVDGLITDAGKVATETAKPRGWYDVSTLEEPYRVEGKKTMGYELAEQLDWTLPDWIVYPTGGGTGLVGMWKAFDEMEAIGWLAPGQRPKMVSVQAEGCAPIVRAFDNGAETARHLGERAHRRRRPARPAGDRRLPDPAGRPRERRHRGGGLRRGRWSHDMLVIGSSRRRLGGARRRRGAQRDSQARRRRPDRPHETVVLFNTGGALKYLDVAACPTAGRCRPPQSPSATPIARAVFSRS